MKVKFGGGGGSKQGGQGCFVYNVANGRLYSNFYEVVPKPNIKKTITKEKPITKIVQRM